MHRPPAPHALASRAGIILGIAVLDGPAGFPADPAYRATRRPDGVVVSQDDGTPLAYWIELRRPYAWEITIVRADGAGGSFVGCVAHGDTAGKLASSFGAWEAGREAEHRLRRLRGLPSY